MPYTVDQPGLSEDTLGQREFCRRFQERRDWLIANNRHPYDIMPLRDEHWRLTGRRFYFSDPNDAFHFRMRFG